MAPARSRKKSSKPFFAGLISGINGYGDLRKLVLDPSYAPHAAVVLLLLGKLTSTLHIYYNNNYTSYMLYLKKTSD